MPAPLLKNRWNFYQRIRQCGACDCGGGGTCVLKVNLIVLGNASWCMESTSCDPACNCYCQTRDASGNLIGNCPSSAPMGTMRNGLCLRCPPGSANPSYHAKCDGSGVVCGGYCLYSYDGTIYNQIGAACKGGSPQCGCPSPPSPDDAVVGEIRYKGPCVAPS